MAAIATLALGASLAPARAANQTRSSIMTMKQDLADREKDIHWPEGFDPSRADLFSHNALLNQRFMRAHLGPHHRRDEVAAVVSELEGRAYRRR
jgi:hypothetical protein